MSKKGTLSFIAYCMLVGALLYISVTITLAFRSDALESKHRTPNTTFVPQSTRSAYDEECYKQNLPEAVQEVEEIAQEQPSRGTVERSFVVTATAYTWTGDRTATGTWPSRGTIAVDPETIPFGTEMYVPGYGYGVASDTGGAIKGNRIDVYVDSYSEAINWGVRDVRVELLGDASEEGQVQQY